MRGEQTFFVYIMANHARSVLYIGFTNNIIRRLIEHRYGFGSKFTAKYKLKYLVYYEVGESVWSTMARENEIKKWRREKKERLIRMRNPGMADLSAGLFEREGITKEEIGAIVVELRNRYGKG